MKPPNFQFSKLIGIFSGLLFLSQIIAVCVIAFQKGDTSFAWYTVPATGTVFATWYVSYANKEKPLNILKARYAYIMQLKQEGTESREVKDEIEKINTMVTDCLDDKTNSAFNEDDDVQNIL